MRSPSRSAAAWLAAALALCVPAAPARAEIIEEIAASVNGKIITRSELIERERAMTGQISARFVGDELDREMERMRKNLLSDMIREEMLLQRAEVLGLELEKVYQQALNQLKDQQGIKTQEELDQVLKQEGITKDELKQTLLRYNVPDIMVNLEVREKLSVTDDEIAERFEKDREQFRVSEEFTIQEIVLMAEGRTDEELAQLGTAVMEQLKAGTAFNELVIQYSQAPSRFNDGVMGPLKRGDLSADLEAAALALKTGEVSQPIPTRAGLHIVKLQSHVLPEEPGLATARTKIIARIKQEKFVVALQKYFKELLATNRIEVHPNYKQYDQRDMLE